MALEASTFSRTLLFLGRAVGGVRGAVRAESSKKTQPNTWPEPFPSALCSDPEYTPGPGWAPGRAATGQEWDYIRELRFSSRFLNDVARVCADRAVSRPEEIV